MGVLDTLLRMDIPKPRTKEIRVKRLSELAGEGVTLTLRELSYSEVARIRELAENDADVHVVLKGVADPVFRDKGLLEKYEAASPAELVKKLLSAGEIAEIAIQVEKLSGYRVQTVEEVKKK